MDAESVRLVWTILDAVSPVGAPAADVITMVQSRTGMADDAIIDGIDQLLARGHLILDEEGTLRRVPDSAAKSIAYRYGLRESEIKAVFDANIHLVRAGDMAGVTAALQRYAEFVGAQERGRLDA